MVGSFSVLGPTTHPSLPNQSQLSSMTGPEVIIPLQEVANTVTFWIAFFAIHCHSHLNTLQTCSHHTQKHF